MIYPTELQGFSSSCTRALQGRGWVVADSPENRRDLCAALGFKRKALMKRSVRTVESMGRLTLRCNVGPMSYPAPFHRLVLIGTLYVDTFNVTMSIVPGLSGTMPAVTTTLIDAVAAQVATWWPKTMSAGGPEISSGARLTSIKLNRIGTNGLYMDPVGMEKLYGSPVAGGDAVNSDAPQLSMVVTLRGDEERAHAGKGRIYLPPGTVTGSLQSDGRITVAHATAQAQAVANLVAQLNDVYMTAGVNAVAGIASKVGTGAFQPIVRTSAGRVIDTMRSRRNKLAEDPQYVDV